MDINLTNVEPATIDPVFGQGIKHLETFMKFSQAAKLPQGNANVRQASHSKKPWKAMLETAQFNPKRFHLLNRGIIYRALHIEYVARTKMLDVRMPDETAMERFGVADGGHTLDVVRYTAEHMEEFAQARRDDVENAEPWTEPYVRVRFLVGGDEVNEDLDQMVEALNTSTQVQQYTLDEYHGEFQDIKGALQTAGWDISKVAFRENDSAEWDVREVVQRMSMFLRDRWIDEPPVMAYKSRARPMGLYKNPETHQEFISLFPVLTDILTLPERIQSEISLSEDVDRRKINLIPHVTVLSKQVQRVGAPQAWPTSHRFNLGAILPLAAAFRELLEKDGEGWKWSRPIQPVVEATAQEFLDLLLKRSKQSRTANALGTDSEYWSGASAIVLRALTKPAAQVAA